MKKYKIGLAVSQFYPDFAEELEKGAMLELKHPSLTLIQAKTPGAIELPLAVQRLFKEQNCAAALALGVVIKGETRHFDSVCSMVDQGLMKLQLKWSKPVIHGVIMAENKEQVKARLHSKNPIGRRAALSCLKMLECLEDLSKIK